MHRLRSLSRGGRLVLALAVGGALFGIASAVQASIPDANGVIHGCYGKPGTTYKGQLRVRDASQGEQCRFYENQLDWNQTGVTGPTGPTGPKGATGAAGISLFANVDADGTLLSGTAISGTKTATPRYHVQFDRDISNCAGSAVVGSTGPTPNSVASGAAGIVQTGLVGNDLARVSFNDDGTFVSTDFKLIIVC